MRIMVCCDGNSNAAQVSIRNAAGRLLEVKLIKA